MKLFTSKSHRIKHNILKFLSKERMKNGGLNQTEKFTFSLKEISSQIGEKYSDVYIISDYLFYKKLVHCIFEWGKSYQNREKNNRTRKKKHIDWTAIIKPIQRDTKEKKLRLTQGKLSNQYSNSR